MPLYDNTPGIARLMGGSDDIKRTYNTLEISEGNAPSQKYVVDPRVSRKYKYQFNTKQDDWVCIPKGLIVSFATNADYISSGAAAVMQANANNSGEGYYFKEFISGKYYHGLTIANGGVSVLGEADQRAIDLGTSNATYTRTANLPIGVLFKNAYYKVDDKMYGSNAAVITRSYIEVPYIPDRTAAALIPWGCATGGDAGSNDPGYLRPGDYVKADRNGHFVKWNPGTLTNISYIGGTPTFVAGVAAKAELAVAAAGTGLNAADAVVIGPVTLTAIAADGTPAAPTATAGQFKIGADAAGTAANLLAAIKAHAALVPLVGAALKAGETTIIVVTAAVKGRSGNSIAVTGNARLTVTSDGSTAATTLTGGVDAGFSSNESAASVAPLYIGGDDPRQIVGQVWDVTGQIVPEGWLAYVVWNLDIEVPELAKVLGLNANDLISAGGLYPFMDKFNNQWKYAASNFGTGIQGLTDGSNIVSSVADEKIGVVDKDVTAGTRLFMYLQKKPVVGGTLKLHAGTGDPVTFQAGAVVYNDGSDDCIKCVRFDPETNLVVLEVSHAVAVDKEIFADYDVTGNTPGVPTYWDLKGSVGAVRILLGGLR